uniref:Uncharacterized protein n=1 Tax=Parascaris univalens TaxID=6257 RepID=A0A915BH38_PARUN
HNQPNGSISTPLVSPLGDTHCTRSVSSYGTNNDLYQRPIDISFLWIIGNEIIALPKYTSICLFLSPKHAFMMTTSYFDCFINGNEIYIYSRKSSNIHEKEHINGKKGENTLGKTRNNIENINGKFGKWKSGIILF